MDNENMKKTANTGVPEVGDTERLNDTEVLGDTEKLDDTEVLGDTEGVNNTADAQSTDVGEDDALTEELNELAKTFSEQLVMVSEEAASADEDNDESPEDGDGFIIQELDEIKEAVMDEVIPKDMLCSCCGERARDITVSSDYEYCAECREAMRRYPIGLQYLILAIAVIALSVVSFNYFMDFVPHYSDMRTAKEYMREGKENSAYELLSEIRTAFDESGKKPEKVMLEMAKLAFDNSNTFAEYEAIPNDLDEVFSWYEYYLPWNSEYLDMRDEVLLFSKTLDKYHEIMSEYDAASEKDLPYDEVIGKLEALIGTQAEINRPSAGDNKTVLRDYNPGAVHFCEYLFAYASGKTEDAEKHLVQVSEELPDRLWLYCYELGMSYAKQGNFEGAHACYDKLIKKNTEDAYAYILGMMTYRLQGENAKVYEEYDKATQAVGFHPETDRQYAVCLILEGKYKEAVDMLEGLIDGSKSETVYLESVYTYAVASSLAEDISSLEYIESLMTEYGVEYSDRVADFFAGKLTAEQLFTEGSGDVI